MKTLKKFKKFESPENSQKGKSTFENSTTDNKLKSKTQNNKLSEFTENKTNNKTILLLKQNVKVANSNRYKPTTKTENTKSNIINLTEKKTNKKLRRNKTQNKLEKSKTKNNFILNHTPSPVKKNKKENKNTKSSLILFSTKNKKEKDNIIPKKTIQNRNNLKNNCNLVKDEFLTVQNTRRKKKTKKIKTKKNNNLKPKEIKIIKRKLSYDLDLNKINLSFEKIKLVNKNVTPPVKINKKNNKENKENKEVINSKIGKSFKNDKNLKVKSKTAIKNKNYDKSITPKKTNKKEFICRTIVYRNKEDPFRNKLISLHKRNEKNNNFNTVSRFKKINISKTINKTIDSMNNSNSKRNLSLYNERNKTYDKMNFKKYNILTHEYSNFHKKLSANIENINNINKNNLHNYLKYTVSALNKRVNKKNEENISKEKIKSKTIEKNIKSVKKKGKDKKTKNNLFQKTTLNRLKSKEKYTMTLESKKSYNLKKLNVNKISRNESNIKEKILSSTSNLLTNSNLSKNNNKKIDDYMVVKELGKGSYATVKLAMKKSNRNKYAMKIYSKKLLLEPQKKSIINNEIKILKQLDNINIVKLYEIIDTTNYLYLIMEYIDGISLLETIKRDKNHFFEEQRALKIFIQILKAIIYCQNKNISHRDIKLENILIIKNDIIKIIDFGFAIKANKETYQNLFCGSPSYMAPEIVNKEKYIAQYSDIWSLGVLLFSMLYGRFPFRAKTQKELFEKINEAKIEFPDDIEINDKIKILLKKIFVVVPTQRPSLNEILNDISLLVI